MRALIVKIGAVGDVIMALPMIAELRRRDPDAQIAWLCGEAAAPIVRMTEGVEIIPINESNLLTGSALGKGSEVIKTWLRLLGRRFDLVLTGYSDPRYRLLSLTTIAGERRSFNRGKGRWCPVPGRHHTDEDIRLVANVDGPAAEPARTPKVRLPLPLHLRSLVSEHPGVLVALAPGGAKNSLRDSPLRRWPLESYGRLARELLSRGLSVAITGAASDAWVRTVFANLPILDLIGKTSLVDLIALYGASAAVVTHDSGPLHLAILADAPTVALFGPTQPSEKILPSERVRVIWGGEDLPCRPCYDGRTYAPCTNNRCLGEISVETVLNAVEQIIAGSQAETLKTEAGAQ